MKNGAFQIALRLIGCVLVLFPHYALARPVNIPGFYGSTITPPQPNTLPQLKPQGVVQGANVTQPSANQLVIDQTQQQAIIDWKSFNISSDAGVQFNQKGQDQKGNPWVGTALNRIWDNSPSQIYGSLKADGKIYLINQNGILFGPRSKVNVNSLTASALNIHDSDFLGNVLKFTLEDYQGTGKSTEELQGAVVSNYGEINAATGGSVFLMGPQVENFGSINATAGQIGLVAGKQVYLATDPEGNRTAFVVDVQDTGVSGVAWNGEGGSLKADAGMAGLYGRVVNQEGVIRSVTAVNQNGQIELRATDKITTGAKSVMESPISDSPETADNSFTFSGGKIVLAGLQYITGSGSVARIAEKAGPTVIDHQGAIDAPSGEVTMSAGQRVFLETGSRINVAGSWSNEAASANVVEAQLNSVELADAFGQKDGILKGQKVYVNVINGSSIGDVSGAILGRQKTALEKSIEGGTIKLAAGNSNSDIIVKQGAVLDFSGGGVNYAGGLVDTTQLVSGTKIYDISNAPLNLQYDGIVGQYKKSYDRFDITETYDGATPKKYMAGFTRGGDAGSLQLTADTVVLDGQLKASVTRGYFQTIRTLQGSMTADDYKKAVQLSQARGLEMPTGGALTIDVTSNISAGSVIAVHADTSPLPPNFGSDPNISTLATSQTDISAKTLNAAGLSSLTLYANAKITTDQDTHIFLSPGGSFLSADSGVSVSQSNDLTGLNVSQRGAFTSKAGRIEHYGDITAPAGTINLVIKDNSAVPASNVPQNEEIFLASGSRLDVSGQKVDNSLAGTIAGIPLSAGQSQGGTITLQDQSVTGRGVFVQDKAVLDVSGGYQINTKGKLAGGDAGTLDIRASTIMLDGDIRGYALADTQGKLKGGQVILQASDVQVNASSPDWRTFVDADAAVPDGLQGLVLAGDRFAETGFTRIETDSFNNIAIGPTVIAPSLVKLKTPVTAAMQRANIPAARQPFSTPVAGSDDLVRLDSAMAYQTGPSSFTAKAGELFPWQDSSIPQNKSAALTIAQGAAIRMAPEGKINLSAAGNVTIGGTLEARAGQINVESKGSGGNADLVITVTGRILAQGYNRLDTASSVPGLGYNYTPRDGGQVSLKASNGALTMEEGSSIDLSGSDVVENRVLAGRELTTYQEAGNSGSLTLTSLGDLTWSGTVDASVKKAGAKGGGLTISRTDAAAGMDVRADDLARYVAAGFDDLTLKSNNSLQLIASADPARNDVTLGRKLTLDAPVLSGSGKDLTFHAPWIELANTSDFPSSGTPVPGGSGQLTFMSPGWIDLIGSITINGFQAVSLNAGRDIRLQDQQYTQSLPQWQGQLALAGDLLLKADRIYPTTLSSYTLKSTGGKVTILPADKPVGGDVYSAGGNLTIEAAKGIEVQGTLAAPMGTITLTTSVDGNPAADSSRIFLADNSVVTTSGNGAMVNYGTIDTYNNNAWTVTDKTSLLETPADTAPVKSVTIDAPEVIAQSNATIDASGGGKIFAYQFQAGIDGTIDPLSKAGRYVIMKDNSIQMPGDAVYLAGGAGLSAGVYSLLPASYAFLPGAIVIEERNLPIAAGQILTAKDGYSVVAGFSTVAGTGIQGVRPKAYAVMSDVLSQGNMNLRTQVAGDGGNVTIKGKTTILDGRISAAALNGFQGGKLGLIGLNIFVQKEAASELPAGFGFSSPDSDLGLMINTLTVSSDGLSGKGFREVDLGDTDNAQTVTIKSGAILEAPIISLAARQQITLEDGSELRALTQKTNESGEGVINLTTPGELLVNTNATIHAANNISLDVNNVNDVKGNLVVDSSAITLKSSNIFFGVRGPSTVDGLYVSTDVWNRFSGYQDITLVGRNDIQFTEDTTLSVARSLTLDGRRIVGNGNTVTVAAQTVSLRNSGSASADTVQSQTGVFTANASDQITIGGGVLLGGFRTVNLNSTNDLSLKGKGSLATSNADLAITAARVVTASDHNATKQYIAPNFTINAGTGAVNMTGSGAAAATSSVSGGLLEIKGRTIELATVLQSDGGTIKLTSSGASAGGSDGIFLHDNGKILARGTDDAPGGQVTLSTDNGKIALETGSSIDVSGGKQLNAGSVTLLASIGGVDLQGDLVGNAGEERDAQGNLIKKGTGGSFVLHTNQSTDLAALNAKLTAGGFTESIGLRSRLGNIEIANGQVLTARHVKLTADDQSSGNGQINVSGEINASTDNDGGTVELYASNDLTIDGTISARGAKGGGVILSSTNGWVNENADGTIDVSGSGGTGGTISLRALRTSETGNDAKMRLNGALVGQSSVSAEAFWVYNGAATIDAAAVSNWQTKTGQFMANAGTIKNNILASGSSLSWFHLLPGIEASNTGDITLGTALDLTTSWRYNNEPGVLTISAGGNLNINAKLVDQPTTMANLTSSDPTVRDSWGFNLVAGADAKSADYMSVNRNSTGNLNIGNQLVYTESAPIRFASGGDTLIGTGVKAGYMINSTMPYNLASYDGSIQGFVGRDLSFTGGAIQTATGDIDISIGRDLILQDAVRSSSAAVGSIRTTGKPTGKETDYWSYAGGGDITLNVGGNVGKKLTTGWVTAKDNNAWDLATPATRSAATWAAKYSSGTAGLAAMGGGNVRVRTGGDFLAQAGAFGQNKADDGDLIIYSDGDISGRFLSHHGEAELHALGNFGVAGDEPQIEAFDSRTWVSAQGSILLGAFVNPTVANPALEPGFAFWNLTYTQNTSVNLKAGGDITMSGNSQFYAYGASSKIQLNERILPATVTVEAGGDIRLLNDFALAPSSQGNLRLSAGGAIDGSYTTSSNGLVSEKRASIYISDMDPANVYTVCKSTADCNPSSTFTMNFGDNLFNPYIHGALYDTASQSYRPLHGNDDSGPVVIQAGQDIKNLKLYLPKRAEISAGENGNIQDVYYFGQNNNPGDVSWMRAGKDITFSYLSTDAATGLLQAGPGALLLQAGNSIDLGSSQGIQSLGNQFNSVLGGQGSSVVVISGYGKDIATTDARNFFQALRDEIEKSGDSYDQSKEKMAPVISGYLGTPSGSGDINMTSTQISTNYGKSDIFVIAAGALNVGKSAFFSNAQDVQNTGILTSGGGAINIFTVNDVNVNESRVMTFFGGDIVVWSDAGNINAGRGSKTAVKPSEKRKILLGRVANEDIYAWVFAPPAVGSGIRALTYDPDGFAGPVQEPNAGDIFPHAKVIDAGEAGMKGRNIFLQAQHVLNVSNISSIGSIVGMPKASGGASIGTLSGFGSATQGSQLTSDASGIGAARAQASQIIDDIMTKWLDVKVLDFVTDENADNDTDTKEDK
jgi:filamentous hemagglutinin family protein